MKNQSKLQEVANHFRDSNRVSKFRWDFTETVEAACCEYGDKFNDELQFVGYFEHPENRTELPSLELQFTDCNYDLLSFRLYDSGLLAIRWRHRQKVFINFDADMGFRWLVGVIYTIMRVFDCS